jgi:predicted amino acid racemase
MAIENLSITDTLTASNRFPVSVNGLDQAVTVSDLMAYVNSNASASNEMTTQYSYPVGESYVTTVTDSSASIFLIALADIGHAAATIKLPSLTNCADKQEVLVYYKYSVTTLTVTSTGATVAGAPTGLATDNAYFRMRFDSLTNTWYRVG